MGVSSVTPVLKVHTVYSFYNPSRNRCLGSLVIPTKEGISFSGPRRDGEIIYLGASCPDYEEQEILYESVGLGWSMVLAGSNEVKLIISYNCLCIRQLALLSRYVSDLREVWEVPTCLD